MATESMVGNGMRTGVKIVLMSLIVGTVLATTGLEPFDVLAGVQNFLGDAAQVSAGLMKKAAVYTMAGALVVLPIWFVIKFFSIIRK